MTEWDDVFVYVPRTGQIIRIAEGSGDNLSMEDEAEGYVDYIVYELYDLDQGMPEMDGGIIMQKQLIRDKYRRLEDAVSEVIEFIFEEDESVSVVSILHKPEKKNVR